MAFVQQDLELQESFAYSYRVECLLDMPNSAVERFDFGPGGPILRITPDDRKAFIITVPGELSKLRLVTWPDPYALFAMPSGYLINVRDPKATAILPGFEGHSVHYLFPVPDKGVVLIGHCCAIYCYDGSGLRWEHTDLFCCDDPAIDVCGDEVVLVAHKHGEDAGEDPTRKSVDLLTGRKL